MARRNTANPFSEIRNIPIAERSIQPPLGGRRIEPMGVTARPVVDKGNRGDYSQGAAQTAFENASGYLESLNNIRNSSSTYNNLPANKQAALNTAIRDVSRQIRNTARNNGLPSVVTREPNRGTETISVSTRGLAASDLVEMDKGFATRFGGQGVSNSFVIDNARSGRVVVPERGGNGYIVL